MFWIKMRLPLRHTRWRCWRNRRRRTLSCRQRMKRRKRLRPWPLHHPLRPSVESRVFFLSPRQPASWTHQLERRELQINFETSIIIILSYWSSQMQIPTWSRQCNCCQILSLIKTMNNKLCISFKKHLTKLLLKRLFK